MSEKEEEEKKCQTNQSTNIAIFQPGHSLFKYISIN